MPARWSGRSTSPTRACRRSSASRSPTTVTCASLPRKVEQDRSQYRIARADRLPTLDGHASLARTSTPSDLQTGASTQRFDLQGLLSYEIDFWGRVAALSESARASFLATEEARRQVYLTLIADVARAYFSVLEKDELIALAHTHAATARTVTPDRDRWPRHRRCRRRRAPARTGPARIRQGRAGPARSPARRGRQPAQLSGGARGG